MTDLPQLLLANLEGVFPRQSLQFLEQKQLFELLEEFSGMSFANDTDRAIQWLRQHIRESEARERKPSPAVYCIMLGAPGNAELSVLSVRLYSDRSLSRDAFIGSVAAPRGGASFNSIEEARAVIPAEAKLSDIHVDDRFIEAWEMPC